MDNLFILQTVPCENFNYTQVSEYLVLICRFFDKLLPFFHVLNYLTCPLPVWLNKVRCSNHCQLSVSMCLPKAHTFSRMMLPICHIHAFFCIKIVPQLYETDVLLCTTAELVPSTQSSWSSSITGPRSTPRHDQLSNTRLHCFLE